MTGRELRAVRSVVVEAVVVAVVALEAFLVADPGDPLSVGMAVIPCLAVAVRRRWPLAALAVSLVSNAFGSGTYACLVTLYGLAARTRNRVLVVVGAVAVGLSTLLPWPPAELAFTSPTESLVSLAYAVAMAAAPAVLGQLVQARRDLSWRLGEILRTQEHERELVAQTVLARERAQLAREMHDVVSHQVSLIAVRSGALQVSADSLDTARAAGTIRQLSVDTLEELRQMVMVLRASGSQPTELCPQPTLTDLHRLVSSSGIEAQLIGEPAPDVNAAAQRAIYRTVQEALTNVRKHAPGARATVEVWWDSGSGIGVTITNTPSTRVSVPLPSARHGLIGLRERAQLLGGSVEAGATQEGGFQLSLRLPLHAS